MPDQLLWYEAGREECGPGATAPRGIETASSCGGEDMATTEQKLIFRFEEGDASMRDLLGGKGANLCEMARMGLPVPPGFVITTEACRQYYAAGRRLPEGLWPDVKAHLSWLEHQAGKTFGGS